MIDAAIVTAIRTRLTSALAPPGERLRPLRVDSYAVGWVNGFRAARLAAFDDVFRTDDDAIRFAPSLTDAQARTDALDRVTRTLAAEGALTSWRDERYAVAPDVGAAPWFVLERAAARYFGVRTFAAHVNGLVGEAGEAPTQLGRSSVKLVERRPSLGRSSADMDVTSANDIQIPPISKARKRMVISR